MAGLPCGAAAGCPDHADPALLDRARAAGADLLLVGGIHKMSTLVQFARLDMVEVATGRVVLDRLYTFRGDTAEAWRQAERFIAAGISGPGSPGPGAGP